MAANIEAVIRDYMQSINAIILNMPKENLTYEMKATDSVLTYCPHDDAYTVMAISHKEEKRQANNSMCDMIGLPLQNLQSADDTCPYCEKPRHTQQQCLVRKFDEDLKDKVKTLIPSLKRIYKAQEKRSYNKECKKDSDLTKRK